MIDDSDIPDDLEFDPFALAALRRAAVADLLVTPDDALVDVCMGLFDSAGPEGFRVFRNLYAQLYEMGFALCIERQPEAEPLSLVNEEKVDE